MIYLMSDLHGEYNMFIKMLDKINFSDKDTLYILGDVVDRGPEPIKILQYIINKPNIILLRGNHEEMLLSTYSFINNELYISISDSRLWMRNGGYVTADQFLDLSKEEQIKIYNYIKKTKLFEILDDNLLVHAGIPKTIKTFNDNKELEKFLIKQSSDYLLWDREMVYDSSYQLENYHIWCGHTPTLNIHGSNKIYESKGFSVIDGGACFQPGILICVCLDTKEVYYQSKIY